MDDSVVKKTQSLLGPLLPNGPPLSDKLLSKPPLRFLHDIFIAIMKEHGLFQGLFDSDEVNWNDAVANDKDSKAFFIAKAINFISLASKKDMQVKALKICAGQEAERTNQLLQELAGMVQRKIDNREIINQVVAKQGPESLLTYPKAEKFFTTTPPLEKPPKAAVNTNNPPEKIAVQKTPSSTIEAKTRPLPTSSTKTTANSQSKIPSGPFSNKGPLKTPTGAKSTTNVASNNKSSKTPVKPAADSKVGTLKKPTVVPSAEARPTTARRAPERPTTAVSIQPMTRRNTFTVEDDEEDSKVDVEVAAEVVVEDKAPSDLRFLEDKAQDEFLTNGLTDDGQPGSNLMEYGTMGGTMLGNKFSKEKDNDSGQLVSNLREAQKEFVDNNGYTKDEVDENLTGLAEQQTARFKKDVDDICNILQKVSRLTDILTTQMEVLPEDLEEMDKDRQRYLAEMVNVQQQLDEAYKVEEVRMEKLRRELAFQEDALFALTEDIASTTFRIRDKRILLNKLVSLKG